MLNSATLFLFVIPASNSKIREVSDEYRWSKLALRKFEYCIVEVFEYLRSFGIEPILIKGWAANRFYPDDRPRIFSDIDISVREQDYESAARVLDSFTKNVAIDLHNEFRHLDTVPWETMYQRSQLIRIDNADVRLLSDEDHLRILCTHWLNDGGQYKERLWDVYFAVANRRRDFDWSICLDSVSKKRRQWVLTTILTTHKYFELDVSDLPFKAELSTLPKWMEECLEKEWVSNVRLRPLHTVIQSPKLFWSQIRKRIPPNPIQATVEMEGDFDDSPRYGYQVRNVLKRILPSIKRVVPAMFEKFKK